MHRHHPVSTTRPSAGAVPAPGMQRLTLAELLAVRDAEERRESQRLPMQLPLPDYR